jgi:hypothetical protein
MIKPFVTLFSFICLCFAAQSANAFQAPSLVRSSSVTSQTAINVFGNKKKVSAADEEKASKFWQGEWVCKDCSGPRRRYAKKVGDVVGTTLDGGDAPILLFSFGGVIATIAFGIWAVNNL